MNCSPKKDFDPLKHIDYRLNLQATTKSLEAVCGRSECILFTALPKTELPSTKMQNAKIIPMEEHFILSANRADCQNGIRMTTMEDICEIELLTRGHADNQQWYSFRKHVITESKGQYVKTCMAMLRKEDSRRDSLNNLYSKIAGTRDVNKQLPSLKYGRTMEPVVNRIF